MSAREVRVRVYAFQNQFSATVERAADQILAAEEDASIKDAAIRWKAAAIPAMHMAVFQTDPALALVEAWLLTAQMARFFESGAGSSLFGNLQHIALDAARQLETEVLALTDLVIVRGDVAQRRARGDTWVAANPIEDLSFGRATTVATFAQFAELAGPEGRGGFGAVASLDQTMNDLANRLAIYMEHLPKQARWQGELLTAEFTRSVGTSLISEMESLTAEVARIAALTDTAPEIVNATMSELLDALTAERAALLDAIDDQRIAIIAALGGIRDSLFESAGEHIQVVLAALDQERAATLADIEAVARRTVDHAIWRAVQVLFGLVVVAALFVAVVTRRRSKKPA